jgi:hypothetical protein
MMSGGFIIASRRSGGLALLRMNEPVVDSIESGGVELEEYKPQAVELVRSSERSVLM